MIRRKNKPGEYERFLKMLEEREIEEKKKKYLMDLKVLIKAIEMGMV